MAEPGEVEFMRRVLVGNGLLPAGRLDAWLARWPGDGSFLRHLVDIGALERSAASTLTAVMKGYLRLSNEALRGLVRLDATSDEPVLEDRVPTYRPTATGEVATPRMQAVEVDTGRAPRETSASTSRGALVEPSASASTMRGAIVDPSASASRRMGDAVADASASTSRGSTLRGRPTTSGGAGRAGAARAGAPRSELHAAVDAALAALDDAPTISRASFESSAGEVRTPVPRDRPAAPASAEVRTPAPRARPRPLEATSVEHRAPGPRDRSAEPLAPASGEVRTPVPKARSSEAPRPVELPAVGDVVAGYQLRQLLGRGASGAVYRASAPGQAHSVVLKLLRPTDEAPGAAAAAQAAVHWRLRHPGVVTLLAAGEHAGLGYLVFEDLFALSLADYLEVTGPLPAPRVAQIGVDVGETLASAADRGIVHGDLKPANLLVYSSNARVKLTDFAGPPAGAGEPRGTPAYLAPELVTGAGTNDPRADMYSLGATLYHAATGRPPFVRPAAVEALRAQVTAVARPVHVVVPGFSHALSGVITRLLHKQPGERYGSWGEVVAALASAEPTSEAVRSDMSERAGEARV